MTELLTTSRGDRVALDRHGAGGDVPAVVFVSGAGPFRASDPLTTRTAELLAEQGVPSLVWDRLGRGESVADGLLDLDREFEAVAALVASAGGRAVLCGHSSGCAIGLAAAARGLGVAGLVLWEGPLATPAGLVAAWATEFGRRLDAGELEAAQEWYMKDMPPEWLAGAKASPAWPAICASAVTLRADAEALRWATAALGSGELRDQVDVDVLAAYGTETFPGMAEAAARVRSVLPGTGVREVPGAGHMWEPAPMAELLAGFVRDVRG